MTRAVRSALVSVSLVIALIVSIMPAGATTAIGSPCSKPSNLIRSGSKVLVCARVGGKLKWKAASHSQVTSYLASQKAILKAAADKAAADKAAADKAAADKAAADKAAADKAAADKAAADCAAGVVCTVGQVGPGGGVVFYDAGSKQPWGQYLEVAPNNWSGGADPTALWCSVQGSLLGVAPPTRKEIGDGLYDTNVMLTMCSSGAANIARAYQGGGKTDWFLPSRKELDQLCLYANSQTAANSPNGCGFGTLRAGFSSGYYWSSSSADSITAWMLYLGTGSWVNWWWNSVLAQCGSNYGNDVEVRPIREF